MDEPLSYEASPKRLVPKITNEIIIDHIIESFGAASQGIICDVHLAIADSHRDHTRSDECKYLAELFARAVDAPKSREIIELDKVYELRAKHCREYPLFMKKYDQPVHDSNSILNKLFIRARRQLFILRDQCLHMPSAQPQSTTLKPRPPRKPTTNTQDEEFQK
jgi:RNA dependent RNA polymerase